MVKLRCGRMKRRDELLPIPCQGYMRQHRARQPLRANASCKATNLASLPADRGNVIASRSMDENVVAWSRTDQPRAFDQKPAPSLQNASFGE